MAVTKAKRSIQKKQSVGRKKKSGVRSQESARSHQKQLALSNQHSAKVERSRGRLRSRTFKTNAYRKLVHFPEARGKIVKDVEFFARCDSNSLALRFEDNTSLAFDFATGFAAKAHFSRWKDGEERVLSYWPRINSEPVF